jgi:hypothetical protein
MDNFTSDFLMPQPSEPRRVQWLAIHAGAMVQLLQGFNPFAIEGHLCLVSPANLPDDIKVEVATCW